MKYPIKCNYISYEKCADSNCYKVKNYTNDQTKLVPGSTIRFIERMDGKTDPMPILRKSMSAEQAYSYLLELDHQELIRLSKTIYCRLGRLVRTIIIFRDSSKYKILAKMLNCLLLLSLIPAIILGILNADAVIRGFLCGKMTIEEPWCYLGLAAGLLFGGMLHEFAHAAACIRYGGRVMEIGVMFEGYPGAYTMMDNEPVRKRIQRIQIFLAGIEINIVLACLSIMICRYKPEWFSFFFEFFIINLNLALSNLLFVEGLDGTAVLGAILGDEDLLKNAWNVPFDIKRENKLKRYGVNGRARIMAAYMLGTTKLFMPILMGFNIAICLGVLL